MSLSSRHVVIGHGLKCGLGHGCREPFTKEIEEMKKLGWGP
jgi:hypothetical protein